MIHIIFFNEYTSNTHTKHPWYNDVSIALKTTLLYSSRHLTCDGALAAQALKYLCCNITYDSAFAVQATIAYDFNLRRSLDD